MVEEQVTEDREAASSGQHLRERLHAARRTISTRGPPQDRGAILV